MIGTAPRRVLVAVATVVAMLAIYLLGMHVRGVRFEASGVELEQDFWMESAQRYRYVEMVARGEPIPNPDTTMWAPDGYDPRSDTILQERLYGAAYRALGLAGEVPLRSFVRIFTRYLYCAGIFALVALTGVLTRSRPAALLACLAYAVILPAVERSTGQVLYREHLAIPLLVFHLYFLASALQRDRAADAVVAGLTLTVAMLAWKVMTFYFLIQTGFFVLAVVLGRARPATVRALAACTLFPVATSLVAPVHLRADRFYTSAPAVLAAVTLAVGALHARRPIPGWARLAAVAGATPLLVWVLPEPHSYGHAWETIAARLTHLGHKPSDPSELGFHARHFWSGNYRSPTVRRALRDFGLPLVAAAPGIVGGVARVRRLRRADGLALVLYLSAALTGGYLVFRKLQAFPAMLLAVLVGLGWTVGRGRLRLALRTGLCLSVAAMVAQAYGWIPGPQRLLGKEDPASAEERASLVHTGADVAALASWLRENTDDDAVILADFVISPYLLVAAGRPVVLNCFFESPMIERVRAYTEALFADEETFLELCRAWQVDYVVHGAHQALRTDDEMSYRYTAAAMDWDPEWPAARMQFAPEDLRHLRLVYQSPFFRVFRVESRPGDAAPAEGSPPAPASEVLFSRAAATALFGDPAVRGWPERGQPADLLADQVRCLTDIGLAHGLVDGAERADVLPLADELLRGASATCPWEPRTYREMAALRAWGWVSEEQADGLLRYAAILERGLAGDGPLPAPRRD